MVSALDKAYDNYEDDGGKVAITGFNFQAYSGIYHMLYMHKNNKKFKISFETDDDIIVENITDNKKLKVQVKSENLTRGSLLKVKNDLCMLGKVLYIKGYDYYIISFPNETGKALKKVALPVDTLIGGDCYKYNSKHEGTDKENEDCKDINDFLENDLFKGKKLIFQELPFTKDSNNSYFFLKGYSESGEDGEKKIPLTKEQLLALLGMIYNKSSKKITPKELDNSIIKEIEEAEEKEKVVIEYIEILKISKSPTYKMNLLKNRGNYMADIVYYNNILAKIELPFYNDEEYFVEYFNNCSDIIKEQLSEMHKQMINKYIIAWFILDKVTKGEG